MATVRANGVQLFYEDTGTGDPVVLVHGSWVDHSSWVAVAPTLAESYRVLTYDRRGYSESETPATSWTVRDDADDLAALIEALDAAPAHVVTNSFGGNVAMRLAVKRPELIRTLAMHEPPIFQLLANDPESAPLLDQNQASLDSVTSGIAAGDHAGSARQFVEEVAFGPGAWDQFPAELRQTFVRHAPTFLNQTRDPDELGADLDGLSSFSAPTLLSDGTESPPIFPKIVGILVDTIPNAQRFSYEGAAHVPHVTHPDEVSRIVGAFLASPG